MGVSSTASALADGKLALAFSVNVGFSDTEALLDGTVTAGGDVLVKADQVTQSNDSSAQFGRRDQRAEVVVAAREFQGAVWKYPWRDGQGVRIGGVGQGTSNVDRAMEDSENDWGVAGSLAVGVHFNEVTARIGADAEVRSGGDVHVKALAEELPSQTAKASVTSTQGGDGGKGGKLFSYLKLLNDGGKAIKNTRDKATSIAVSVGAYETTSKAYVDDRAIVDAAGDLVVRSESLVPYEILWLNFGGALSESINGNMEIRNGVAATWAQASAAGLEKAWGGNFSATGYKNVSKAFIGENATITVGDQLDVRAFSEVSTTAFAGSAYGTVDSAGDAVGGTVLADVPVIVAEAVIKSGATVLAGSALVKAESKGRSVAIGNFAGTGESFVFSGVNTWQWADHRTLAKIDDGAEVTTTGLTLEIDRDFGFASASERDSELLLSPVRVFGPLVTVDNDDNTRVNPDNDSIDLPYNHDLSTGDPVVYDSGGGDAIVGLTSGNTYYAIRANSSRLKLAETLADAESSTAIDIGLTGSPDTTGNAHSLFPAMDPAETVSAADDWIVFDAPHNLVDGQPLLYRNGDNDPAIDATSIGGLSDGTIYYAYVVDDKTIQLARTQQDGYNGTNIIGLNLTSTAGGGHSFTPRYDRTYDDGIDPASTVTDAADTIDLGRNHGFISGESVIYSDDGGSAIGVLVDGEEYFVSVVDNTTFQLTDSDGVVQDLSWTGGAGESHQITPNPNGVRFETLLPGLDTNGDGKITTADDNVVAVTGDSYTLNLSVLVAADDVSQIYSGAGAVILGRSCGAGVSIVDHVIDRNTKAIIGNEQRLLDTGNFAPGVGVDSGGIINPGYAHGFVDGDEVGYVSGGDFTIHGLLDGQAYVIGDATANTFRIARTPAGFTSVFEPKPMTVDEIGDLIDLGYAHEFQLGDPVRYDAGGGTAIDGLTDGDTYYVIPVTSTDVALAASNRDALREEKLVFAPRVSVVSSSDEIAFPFKHGLSDDQPVFYRSGGGTTVGGLTEGSTYYVQVVDESTIRLAATPGGNAVNLDRSTARGETHTLQPGFDPTAALDEVHNTIQLGYEHGLRTGEAVRYDAAGGVPIVTGDADGLYHAIVIDESTIALASTQDQAFKGREWFFDAEEDIDYSADTIELFFEHEFADGDEVRLTLGGVGTSPASGLVDGGVYYTRTVAGQPTRLQLEDSAGTLLDFDVTGATDIFFMQSTDRVNLDASGSVAGDVHFLRQDRRVGLDASTASGVSHAVRLTLDGSSANRTNHAIGRTFDPASAIDSSADTIDLGYTHNLTTGQKVVYSSGQGGDIGGLAHGDAYYAIVIDATTIQLASSSAQARAAAPTPVEIDLSGTSGNQHAIGAAMRTTPVVDGTTGTIKLGHIHGFETGDEVVYRNGGGTSIHDAGGGSDLVDGGSYFVIAVDDFTMQLASSEGDALAETALHLNADAATGNEHRLDDPESATGFVASTGEVSVKATNRGQIISVSLAAALVSDYPWGASRAGVHKKDLVKQTNAESGIAVAGDAAFTVIHDTARAYVLKRRRNSLRNQCARVRAK